jgi:hypothetical protein
MYITLFYSRIQNLELFIKEIAGTSKMASIHVRFFGILSHLKILFFLLVVEILRASQKLLMKG